MNFIWDHQILPEPWLLVKMYTVIRTDGFHMEKSFTEREFQTNYNVNVEKVSYKSLMHRGWLLR